MSTLSIIILGTLAILAAATLFAILRSIAEGRGQ